MADTSVQRVLLQRELQGRNNVKREMVGRARRRLATARLNRATAFIIPNEKGRCIDKNLQKRVDEAAARLAELEQSPTLSDTANWRGLVARGSGIGARW